MAAQEAHDEILTASSSSSSSSDHGWQKVTYPKRQRKTASSKVETSDPLSDLRSGAEKLSVFASVEKKALERRRALEIAARPGETVIPVGKKVARRRWGDSDEDSSESDEVVVKDEVKKVKEKKVKKPKMTVQEAGSSISSEDLATFLVDIGVYFFSIDFRQFFRLFLGDFFQLSCMFILSICSFYLNCMCFFVNWFFCFCDEFLVN